MFIQREFYIIINISNGHIMPNMNGRGTTHWDPEVQDDKLVPRLFRRPEHARRAITQWVKGKQTANSTPYTPFSPFDNAGEFKIKVTPVAGRNVRQFTIKKIKLKEIGRV